MAIAREEDRIAILTLWEDAGLLYAVEAGEPA